MVAGLKSLAVELSSNIFRHVLEIRDRYSSTLDILVDLIVGLKMLTVLSKGLTSQKTFLWRRSIGGVLFIEVNIYNIVIVYKHIQIAEKIRV